MDHVKIHFAHGEKVGAGLHTLGDRAAAKAVGDVEDLPACGSLQAIVGATGNELTVDLDLDKREIVQPDKRETLRTEIIDRNGDVAEPDLSCNGSCQVQIGNEIRGTDFNDKPVKCGVIWDPAAKIDDRIRIAEKIERQIDRDLYGAGSSIVPPTI